MQAQGLTRTVLALLFMAILVAASFSVLQLFLTSLIWATMIVVSTWPIMLNIQRGLWGRRSLAVAVMTLLLLLVLVLPISLAVGTFVIHYEEIVSGIRSLVTLSIPQPPDWIGHLPFVGGKIVAQWQHVIAIGPTGISSFLTPYVGRAISWVAAITSSASKMIIQFFLTVFMAAVFYQRGDAAAVWLSLFARRIAGHSGGNAINLAYGAIQAVAIGVVGTAIIQTVLSGLGLIVCGVPGVVILIAVIFMLELAQVGPMPVLLPAVIWLFWQEHTVLASGLAVWTVLLSAINNMITPILMKKGADLPMVLVFVGVTGGMMAFGVVGLFVGPVVLAVTYTLLDAWVTGEAQLEEQACGEEELHDAGSVLLNK
jgi:predicted PurR-regulated permease PerM